MILNVAPIDKNQVYDALKRINAKKSVGPDSSTETHSLDTHFSPDYRKLQGGDPANRSN